MSHRNELTPNWDRNFRGIPDYSRINTLKQGNFNTFDFRIDKKWFFKKCDLNLYLDIQNALMAAVGREVLLLDRPLDENMTPIGGPIIVNPDAPVDQQRYKLKSINDATGTLLPTLGVVISI